MIVDSPQKCSDRHGIDWAQFRWDVAENVFSKTEKYNDIKCRPVTNKSIL